MPTLTTEHEIISTVRTFYDQARAKKKPRLGAWNRNYRIVNNQTWATARPGWMPDTRVSEVFPILAALVGWMTDQRSSIEVSPSADPHSGFFEVESQLARDLQKVMESLWLTKDWDRMIEQVLWDAMLYGTGFFKVVWDAADDMGLGNPRLVRIDPFTIYPDPNATSFEDVSYIIEARKMSLDELDRRFPGASARVEAGTGSAADVDQRDDIYSGNRQAPMANPGAMSGSSSSVYGLPGQGRQSATNEAGVVVLEAWLRENELWLDEDGEEYTQDVWRFVAICGDQILADEKAADLWGYAKHPYSRFVNQDIGEMWGISLCDHLYPVQDSLNRLLSAMQNNAELVGNPVFVENVNAGISRTQLTNKPGTRLKTEGMAGEVRWLDPPQMPAQVLQLIQFWESAMERISGLSAIVRGGMPNNRASQGTMDQVQESAFVRVRSALRNLERSLRTVGEMTACLIVDNYTAPRIVAIVGPDGEQTAVALSSSHFSTPSNDPKDNTGPLKYQLWIRAGSALPTSRQARAAEADTLLALGALDPQAVLEAHDYPNRQAIIERLKQAAMLGIQQGGSARQNAGRPS